MTDNNRQDEQNTAAALSLADTVMSHTQWARSIVSPWVQRMYSKTRRSNSAGISASYTLDRVHRVQHKAYEANAWHPDVGSVSPASLQQFAGSIMRRHQSFQAKATARVSQPQSEQETASNLPLAHPGGVRVAAEGTSDRSPEPPTGSFASSTPAQPVQPPAQSPERPSQPAQSSESSDMPPLPSNHPLNTGDVPTKRVQRQSSPSSTPASPSPSQPQQPPKRRRIYSRVEEITPGGAMTEISESSDAISAEPEPPPEQPIDETDDVEDVAEPAATPDAPSAEESAGDSNAVVQRTTREVTPPSSLEPKPADSDSALSPQQSDSQQSTPTTQTQDTSTVQRAPDQTDEQTIPPPATPQPDDETPVTEEPETAEEPAGSHDDTSIEDGDSDSGPMEQRSVQQETPASPAQPKSTDSDATTSQRRPDDTMSSTQSRDSSTIQRTVDKHVSPPLSESQSGEDTLPPEEPQTTEKSAADTGDAAVSRDIQREAESSEQKTQPAVHDEHSEDSPQQPSASESTPETHSSADSSDVTIQRSDSASAKPVSPSPQTEADTGIASETIEPATEDADTIEAVGDTTTPESPTDESQQSPLQRTPEEAPTTSPPAEGQEDAAPDAEPPAPTREPQTRKQMENQPERIDNSEASVSQSKETGSKRPSGDDVVQRSWDTPATQPPRRSSEPADRPEDATDAGDTTTADTIETPTGPLEESDLHASDDIELEESSGPEHEVQQSTADHTHVQRAAEHDTGTETPQEPDPAKTSQDSTEVKKRSRPERPAEDDTPSSTTSLPAKDSPKQPSAGPKPPTETKPASTEATTVQKNVQDEVESPTDTESLPTDRESTTQLELDSEAPSRPKQQGSTGSDDVSASIQREPDEPGEQTDTATTREVAQTPTTSDDTPAPMDSEAQPSDEPTSVQHDADQAIQRIESPKDGATSTEPSRERTVQRSPGREVSGDTTVQRRSDTPDVPAQHDVEKSPSAEPQPDNGAPRVESDDTTPVEPEAQRTASVEHAFSEDISRQSDDTPAPSQKPAPRQAEAGDEPISHTPESSQESATVQRTIDESPAAQTSDVTGVPEATSESAAPSKPASPRQIDEPQREAPAQELHPQPPSEPASEKTTPSGDTTLRADIQRQPDEGGPTKTSEAMPLLKPHTVRPAESTQDDAPTDSTIQRKPTRDVSAPRPMQAAPEPETRTETRSAPVDTSSASPEPDGGQHRTQQRDEPDSPGLHAEAVTPDTQRAIRKAPAPDRAPVPESPDVGLHQTIASRAESHSRLPLATQHTIRRKMTRSSDDIGISQPTEMLRRVRSQVQARSARSSESGGTNEQSDRRGQEIQHQPADGSAPMPETSHVTELQSDASGDTPARSNIQPAPQVSPPIFTPATRTSESSVIQRTPLELVQRVSPSAGSEAKPEPTSETISERDADERDEEQEINLERLARDVYPLIKRMIAIERERRPGR